MGLCVDLDKGIEGSMAQYIPPYHFTSSLIISMTSHSKMLLSLTRPHDMPGMSLSVCICLSCLRSREADPVLAMAAAGDQQQEDRRRVVLGAAGR